jgi:hypothetical protein
VDLLPWVMTIAKRKVKKFPTMTPLEELSLKILNKKIKFKTKL